VALVVEPRLEPEEPDEVEVGSGVVPETTGLAKPDAAAAVMSVSSDPDIDAAARSERAAIDSTQHGRLSQ
jgi:hypothetical protein